MVASGYMDVFTELLEDAHNVSVKRPGCNRQIACSNPHNFFTHTSETALACVPLCWLAMLPIASLPASIRARLQVEGGAPVVPLAAGVPVAAAAALRDAPAALAVPGDPVGM